MIRRLAFVAALFAAPVTAESFPEANGVVTIGGPITEIVFALGEGDRVIARDTTSVYPSLANQLPDVGYMRALSAEGVLSVGPDLIIARSTSGPLEALDQLQSASIPLVFVEDAFTPEGVLAAIELVGSALGVPQKAEALKSKVNADLAALAKRTQQLKNKKKILFILSLEAGRINAAGSGTGADGFIALSGGINVMADEFEGYKLVNAEAVIKAAPDVVVMMNGRADHSGRKEEVLNLPGVNLTPAGQTGSFLTIPGAALGFGPRVGALGLAFHGALYGLEG